VARERLRAFTLEKAAPRIRQPLLIVFGRRDRLFPAAQAERLAAAAPNAELVMYETGNHVCTNLHSRHTPMEADWLAARLA
jgi:pimeloyl-ACP methyl ester carboxylesterase